MSLIDPNGGSNVFQPALGDTFNIVTTAIDIAGSFEMEVLPALSSNLAMRVFYSEFSVTLAVVPALAGDYNANGVVDAADYTVWRDSLGQTGTGLAADGNGDGMIDAGDYTVWKSNFGTHLGSGSGANAAVPEPATLAMLFTGVLTLCCRRRASAS